MSDKPDNIIHFPRLMICGDGMQCVQCQQNLQGYVAHMQKDGTLLCFSCIGANAKIPPDVIKTIREIEREHGHR